MHTISDQLIPVQQENTHAARVAAAGDANNLRQSYADAIGHCNFTSADVVAAINTVVKRIDTGHWADTTTATSLNTLADTYTGLGGGNFLTYRPTALVVQPTSPHSRRGDTRSAVHPIQCTADPWVSASRNSGSKESADMNPTVVTSSGQVRDRVEVGSEWLTVALEDLVSGEPEYAGLHPACLRAGTRSVPPKPTRPAESADAALLLVITAFGIVGSALSAVVRRTRESDVRRPAGGYVLRRGAVAGTCHLLPRLRSAHRDDSDDDEEDDQYISGNELQCPPASAPAGEDRDGSGARSKVLGRRRSSVRSRPARDLWKLVS